MGRANELNNSGYVEGETFLYRRLSLSKVL